jgi:hypothetical protein
LESEVMGHIGGLALEKSYQNQILDVDIMSAYLEKSSDDPAMKLMGRMALT